MRWYMNTQKELRRIAMLFLCCSLAAIGCGSLDEGPGADAIVDADPVTKVDFDELELDIDGDGASDLFGKLYRDPLDSAEVLKLHGILFAARGWKILSHSNRHPDKGISCNETWPLYRGDTICYVDKSHSETLCFDKGRETLAFTAMGHRNRREELLATGNLTSGHEQYVALMKEVGTKRYFAWVDISINPVLKLQWEDKDLKIMGYDYYCETEIRKHHFESTGQKYIFAGQK